MTLEMIEMDAKIKALKTELESKDAEIERLTQLVAGYTDIFAQLRRHWDTVFPDFPWPQVGKK